MVGRLQCYKIFSIDIKTCKRQKHDTIFQQLMKNISQSQFLPLSIYTHTDDLLQLALTYTNAFVKIHVTTVREHEHWYAYDRNR